MAHPTVLVIEDDPAVARALRRALKLKSIFCQVAGSAEEVRKLDQSYRLAIVDVNLPDGNGIDLYDELHANKRVDVGVFFTATDDENDRARAHRLGPVIAKSQGVAAAVDVALASLEQR